MNPYLRFSIITLFFTICIIYVLIPRYSEIETSNIGWTNKDKQEFIASCIGDGIGSKELCNCVLSKLQIKFSGLQDMYTNPQMRIIMKTVSSECKK